MSVTVPASVLEALGGMVEGDPPVLVAEDPPSPGLSYFPGATPGWEWMDDDELMLPSSSAALRRVLARHLGWTLGVYEVPNWWRAFGALADRPWVLERANQAEGGHTFHQSSNPHGWSVVPALAGILDPMEALAIVLTHLAEEAS